MCVSAELGLKSSLHPMDCVDVIMASVRNDRLFISDFYSRDRSTPLEDYWYDGEMSLSAAYGTQQDGRSIVMFRRELRGTLNLYDVANSYFRI